MVSPLGHIKARNRHQGKKTRGRGQNTHVYPEGQTSKSEIFAAKSTEDRRRPSEQYIQQQTPDLAPPRGRNGTDEQT